ncbi:MAG: hypothetical protein ABR541_01505 [Candidatus Dormibacteria bacterium]
MGFHRVWAFVVLALLLVAVVAGLLALRREAWQQRYATYLRVCTGAIAIQAVVGLVLLFSGERPHRGLHFLFGPVVLITLPVAARIGERRQARRSPVLLGGATFAFAMALLSLVTGGGGS